MLTLCKNYGVRVQDSVFECEINCDLYEKLKIDVENLIELNQDSVIFYRISHDWRRHVERLGVPKSQDLHRDVYYLTSKMSFTLEIFYLTCMSITLT